MKDYWIITYTTYLILCIPLTIWVARTLHRNGRAFLIEAFDGQEEIADNVNHLLVVGFYLINFGFIALYLKVDQAIETTRFAMETTFWKIGIVILVLGVMHFFNIIMFNKMRKEKAHQRMKMNPPPVPTRRV